MIEGIIDGGEALEAKTASQKPEMHRETMLNSLCRVPPKVDYFTVSSSLSGYYVKSKVIKYV